MQLQLFPKRIVDHLGSLGGTTGPQWVRAEDGLSYVAKDEAPAAPLPPPHVRASEYLWLSIASAIGLPAPAPIIMEDRSGRLVVGTRRENSALTAGMARLALYSGRVANGGTQLSKIYAYDLFSANWDRHIDNYLVLDDGAGQNAVFVIDLSHVTRHPGAANYDPLSVNCATRQTIGLVLQPYGKDIPAALDVLSRLDALPVAVINDILASMPLDWLPQTERADVTTWWSGFDRTARITSIKQGLSNGTLI
jgi:hypothetical protein